MNPGTDQRIISFLSSQPDALIYHHPAWLTALQEESGQQCFMLACESADGSLCGIMPLAYTQGIPFNISHHQIKRRVSSLPRTPFAGPISTSPEVTDLLLTAAIERAESEGIQLQIKADRILPRETHGKLVRTEWRPTYSLALPESLDQLKFGNAQSRHRLNWSVKKAKKLGMTVRFAEMESDLAAWYQLYLTTMRRNFVPPRRYKFFISLWRELRKSGLLRLLLAERSTNGRSKLVAGSIFLMTGKTVFYAFTGCLTEHLCAHANDLILWEAIHQACREGYRFFDFGEVPEEHPELVRFKKKWGSAPRALYRYYLSHPENDVVRSKSGLLRRAVSEAWQYVPLSVTARIGGWIYGYL